EDKANGSITPAVGHDNSFGASEQPQCPLYRAFTPDDLFDIVARHNIHFDQTRQTGIVFHMMSALGEHGRVGLTAVGNRSDEADALFAKAVEILDREARLASDRESAIAHQ